MLLRIARGTGLLSEPGGFGYDTCAAWGEPGKRWMGCDEFFPQPHIYKDLRKDVPKGCAPTRVQFVPEGEVNTYPWGVEDPRF
mmetsp:Transcript_43182/g.105643  ORF Transcript_43182/g.105643 Transcript_43182/m.105643 type:complete len:83 (+) Transcript_43182:187-435(+)